MDKIILSGMEFYGYHGLFPEENKLGQRFYVDAELMIDLRKSGKSDDMKDSINYGDVYQRVQEIVQGTPRNLVEALAEDIAADLLGNFPLLESCKLRVTKPDPPIPGHYKSVAVEIFRERFQ